MPTDDETMLPEINIAELEDAADDTIVVRPTFRNGGLKEKVHELRKSNLGREILRQHSRNGRHAYSGSDRPFVFWDGEGFTDTRGQHHYILFGCGPDKFVASPSLGSLECMQLMLKVESENPEAIHVGFAFKYDAERILIDVPRKIMERVHKENHAFFGRYRIEYFPGKWLMITGPYNGRKVTCKIWDIFGFFQQSFVAALRSLFPDPEYADEFNEIEKGKKHRSNFNYGELDTMIKPYWESELKWGVRVIDHLRKLLYEADIKISMWHGPGAIANYLFKSNGIIAHKDETVPVHIANAAQFAFAGGRFEPFKLGRSRCKIYVYDLNSAHPSGMAKLPSLNGAKWLPVSNPGEVSKVGIYRVTYNFFGAMPFHESSLLMPQPFFHRDQSSLVSFPSNVQTWIWSPELYAFLRTMPNAMKMITIHEAWELQHDESVQPFAFINEMYEKRQYYKSRGEHVQMAYKLGLNSLFGKTAQRVGWNESERRIPQWHQLEWAGLITSNTRALLWDAIIQAAKLDALVSVDTDAVFSTEPLDLPISNKLGEWDYEVYEDMVYLQNGIYWLLRKDGTWKSKYRGLDPDSLTVDTALDWFRETDINIPFYSDGEFSPSAYQRWRQLQITGRTTRFVGSKAAFHGDELRRGNWYTEPRTVNVGTMGKRLHFAQCCRACLSGVTGDNGFHDLTLAGPSPIGGPVSFPHFIPWRDLKGGAPWEDLQDQMYFT